MHLTSHLLVKLLFGVFLRWAVSLHGYSGENKPPMFGDYEAQRHWMEITYNLPIDEWYFNTSNNDLQYWGLDYPPLTAYHSWAMGYVASSINPAYVALFDSRGYETQDHKLFMRLSVLASDVVFYLTAVCMFSYHVNNVYPSSSKTATSFYSEVYMMVIYPGLILIDHGHFQYNCVSLGLTLFSLLAVWKSYDILGAILYCLALSYKQMVLYYSLPYFFYFIGKCKSEYDVVALSGLKKLFEIGITVILTFSVVWFPFLDKGQILQVLHRIFPLNRGLFEDKVSNVWCLLNIFYKFRDNIPVQTMALVSGCMTLLAVLPSCINLFVKPTPEKFLLSLINSSLAFFLFSYQVHEKTILIAALPVMIYYKWEPLHCFWFLVASTFSMFPLILKDHLLIPFVALTVLYIVSELQVPSHFRSVKVLGIIHVNWVVLFISSLGFVILTLLHTLCPPPQKYPDLFPLLISAYSSVHFIYFYLYFNWKQIFYKHSEKKT